MIRLDEPDFSALPPALARLFAAAGATSFFALPQWYDLVARYAMEPQAQARLYCDAAAPAAALVCRTEGARRLEGLANFYTIEHGPIVADASPATLAALSGLATAIAAERPALDAILLPALDADDAAYAALAAGLRAAGWAVQRYFHFAIRYEATRALSFAGYLDARPSQLRNTFRRKEKSGAGLTLAFSGEADLETLLADYDTVYRNSWKAAEPYPAFMPALIRAAAAAGALRMGVLRVDGAPAAAQFWLLWQGRAVIFKLAYDERFARASPGTILTMRMIERVLERDRPDEINFGRGDDDYKRQWLPRRRERWGLFAANPRTLRGAGHALAMLAGGLRRRLRPRPAGLS